MYSHSIPMFLCCVFALVTSLRCVCQHLLLYCCRTRWKIFVQFLSHCPALTRWASLSAWQTSSSVRASLLEKESPGLSFTRVPHTWNSKYRSSYVRLAEPVIDSTFACLPNIPFTSRDAADEKAKASSRSSVMEAQADDTRRFGSAFAKVPSPSQIRVPSTRAHPKLVPLTVRSEKVTLFRSCSLYIYKIVHISCISLSFGTWFYKNYSHKIVFWSK